MRAQYTRKFSEYWDIQGWTHPHSWDKKFIVKCKERTRGILYWPNKSYNILRRWYVSVPFVMRTWRAQLLMGRQLKGKLPALTSLLTPGGAVQVRRQLREKQEEQKLYYDRQTRQLSGLQAGENVRIQRGEIWKPAVVLHKHEPPQSFVVCTQDGRLEERVYSYDLENDRDTF